MELVPSNQVVWGQHKTRQKKNGCRNRIPVQQPLAATAKVWTVG